MTEAEAVTQAGEAAARRAASVHASAVPSRDGCEWRSGVSGASVTEAEAIMQAGEAAARRAASVHASPVAGNASPPSAS